MSVPIIKADLHESSAAEKIISDNGMNIFIWKINSQMFYWWLLTWKYKSVSNIKNFTIGQVFTINCHIFFL
jgi:hypothetical protein